MKKNIIFILTFFSYLTSLVSIQLNAQERAQNPVSDMATPYLHLGHTAYAYILLLQSRGLLSELNAGVRPYKRGDVAAALMRIDSEITLSSSEKFWIHFLRNEFRNDIRLLIPSEQNVQADAGSELSNVLFTEDNQFYDNYRIDPFVHFSVPHFTSGLRGRLDRSLIRDQFYTGRKTDYLGARVEDGYGRFDYRAFYCAIGRFAEEWSPVADHSLILSPEAYTYDKFQIGVLTKNVQFRSLFAMLDDFNTAKRYLSAHRLDIRLNNGMQFGFSESVIYGGVNQTVDLSYLNPFAIFAEVQLNQKKEANENIAFDFYIPYKRFVFAGQILIDDFILDGAGSPPPNRKTSPDRLGIVYRILGNDIFIRNTQTTLTYKRIGSYTYNVKQKRPWQSYTYLGRGLGASANDGDQILLSWKYFPIPKWIFDADIYYHRQGERTLLSHDFEDPTFVKLPFPSGRVEKTSGMRIGASFQYIQDLHIDLETGLSRVTNYLHTTKNKTIYHAMVNIDYHFTHTLFTD